MKIKVVGLENDVTINFTDRETKVTNTYHGRRIHYHYTLPSGEGIGCSHQFLNDTKFINVPVNVGEMYNADMNYGKITYLEDVNANHEIE